MKILRLALAAFVLLGTASCQKEVMDEGVPRDGKVLYQINLGIQDLVGENTRTLSNQTSSAKGGITNVDYAKYDLRYIISVYDKGSQNLIVNRAIKTLDSYEPTTLNLRLSPNKEYRFVVWADFVEQGKTEDLHYNTSDLTNITCIDEPDKQLNDESRDAFTQVRDEALGDEGKNIDIVLKRPFAKIRVITTDWNTKGINNEMPDNFKITYYGGQRFNNYNAITKESSSTELGDLSTNPQVYTREIAVNKEEKYYKIGYDMTPANRTLTVDYLMTDKSQQTPIHLKFEAYNGTKLLRTYDFKNNVPIQRNYLTTLLGNLLTLNTEINVSINEYFKDQYNDLNNWFEAQGFTPTEPKSYKETHDYRSYTVYEIKTPEELMYVSKKMEEVMGKGIFIIKLCSDIDMKGVDWMPMNYYRPYYSYGSYDLLFDGQGHTMRNFNINKWSGKYESSAGVFGYWKGHIKDLTIENVTINVPEDSNLDYPYIGGVVGYIVGGIVKDVHVKHVFIKSPPSLDTTIGGLIGATNNFVGWPPPLYEWAQEPFGQPQTRMNPPRIYNYTQVINCSATDVHISGGNSVGGLIGKWMNLQLDIAYGPTEHYLPNKCSTDYIYLRLYSGIEEVAVSPFLGRLSGYSGDIVDCTPAAHFEIVDAKTGESLMDSYQPYSEYIGTKQWWQ